MLNKELYCVKEKKNKSSINLQVQKVVTDSTEILVSLPHNDEQYKLWNFDPLNFETQKQAQNNLFELLATVLMIFWFPFINKVSLLNKLD